MFFGDRASYAPPPKLTLSDVSTQHSLEVLNALLKPVFCRFYIAAPYASNQLCAAQWNCPNTLDAGVKLDVIWVNFWVLECAVSVGCEVLSH